MAEITVLYNIKEEPSKEKINEELKWYDIIKKEMQYFKGGKLAFKYKEDEYLVKMGKEERQRRGIKTTYRTLPLVEDLEVNNHFNMIKTTNQKNIEKWFNSYNNYSEATIEETNRESIVFEVPDNEKEDFCYELERRGFKYE